MLATPTVVQRVHDCLAKSFALCRGRPQLMDCAYRPLGFPCVTRRCKLTGHLSRLLQRGYRSHDVHDADDQIKCCVTDREILNGEMLNGSGGPNTGEDLGNPPRR
jgi:hypothetical protein